MVYNMPIFGKNYFLVIRAYGPKWPQSLIQYGGQMTTMVATFFDPQMTYLQDLKSNQIHSSMHTQPTPVPAVLWKECFQHLN